MPCCLDRLQEPHLQHLDRGRTFGRFTSLVSTCILNNWHYAEATTITPLDKWLIGLTNKSFVSKDMRLCLSKSTLIFSLVNGLWIFRSWRSGVMFIVKDVVCFIYCVCIVFVVIQMLFNLSKIISATASQLRACFSTFCKSKLHEDLF